MSDYAKELERGAVFESLDDDEKYGFRQWLIENSEKVLGGFLNSLYSPHCARFMGLSPEMEKNAWEKYADKWKYYDVCGKHKRTYVVKENGFYITKYN